jgi:hypothetical protein
VRRAPRRKIARRKTDHADRDYDRRERQRIMTRCAEHFGRDQARRDETAEQTDDGTGGDQSHAHDPHQLQDVNGSNP